MSRPRRPFAAVPAEQHPQREWNGIAADDPPQARHDHADLLAMAQTMLATRERRFPDLIAQGRLSRDEAEAELATFRALVADWRWIVSGEGEPAGIETLAARQDAIDNSLATIAALARDRGGFSDELARQAQCVIALRWHLEPGRQTHALASLTRDLRRRALGLCPSCERRPEDPATRSCTRTDCGLPGRAQPEERTAA